MSSKKGKSHRIYPIECRLKPAVKVPLGRYAQTIPRNPPGISGIKPIEFRTIGSVGKVPVKKKLLNQTPVGMANAPTSAKYAPIRPNKNNKRKI